MAEDKSGPHPAHEEAYRRFETKLAPKLGPGNNRHAMQMALYQQQVASSGQVMFLDYEGDPTTISERLAAMGVEIPLDSPLMQPVEFAAEAPMTMGELVEFRRSIDDRPPNPNRAQRRAEARRQR